MLPISILKKSFMLSGMKLFSTSHLFLRSQEDLLLPAIITSYSTTTYMTFLILSIPLLYMYLCLLFILWRLLPSILALINNDYTTKGLIASVLVVEDLWCARSDAELYSTGVERLRSSWKKACLISTSTTTRISSED